MPAANLPFRQSGRWPSDAPCRRPLPRQAARAARQPEEGNQRSRLLACSRHSSLRERPFPSQPFPRRRPAAVFHTFHKMWKTRSRENGESRNRNGESGPGSTIAPPVRGGFPLLFWTAGRGRPTGAGTPSRPLPGAGALGTVGASGLGPPAPPSRDRPGVSCLSLLACVFAGRRAGRARVRRRLAGGRVGGVGPALPRQPAGDRADSGRLRDLGAGDRGESGRGAAGKPRSRGRECDRQQRREPGADPRDHRGGPPLRGEPRAAAARVLVHARRHLPPLAARPAPGSSPAGWVFASSACSPSSTGLSVRWSRGAEEDGASAGEAEDGPPLRRSVAVAVVASRHPAGGRGPAGPGATEIARGLGASETTIGFTLVALGTSLPELATLDRRRRTRADPDRGGQFDRQQPLQCARRARISAAAAEVAIEPALLAAEIPGVVLLTLLAGFFMLTGRRIARIEGVVLLAAYAGYAAFVLL